MPPMMPKQDPALPPNPYISPDAYLYLDAPFTEMYAAADKPQIREALNDAANHWRLWFVVGPATSVVLDMVKQVEPDENGRQRMGCLGITTKPFKLTWHHMHAITAHPTGDRSTIRAVFDALVSRGRLNYQFTESIHGCAWWVETAVRDMERASLIMKPPNANYAEATVADAISAASAYFYMRDKDTGEIKYAPYPPEHERRGIFELID